MENFLPALLIIGGVIYKIYTEYQKEQDKARRRMPQVPQHPAPIPPEPQPTVVEPMMPVPIPLPPKKTERLSPVTEEAKKIRDKKSTNVNETKKIAVESVLDIENGKENIIPFDLREAVIQAAILNRPYQ